jgi:hypothetical protein
VNNAATVSMLEPGRKPARYMQEPYCS